MIDFNDAPTRAQLQLIDNSAWEARLERLRARLKQDARSLVAGLYPRARQTTGEARIGSVAGEDGESLSIGLSGDRTGLWHDHATGEGGDLIDLWIKTQGYGANEFAKAVSDLEIWAGISDQPRWRSPVAQLAEKRKTEVDRQGAPKPDQGLGAPVANYHYLSADGQLLGIVRRYHLANGKKTFLQFNAQGEAKSPDPRPLYRLPQIRSAETVVLVEGEKCADALAALGIEATSAMGGAKTNLEKIDWSPLAAKTVLLWADNDAPGREFVERVEPLLKGLGCETRTIAIPPGKPEKWDAADAVAEGEDVHAIIATAQPAEQTPAKPKIPIYSRRQLRELKRPDWIIDEVVVERSVIAVYGPSGSLKSFVAIDISMSTSTGLAWHGREVKQGPVVYVTGEGRDQINLRLEAWERAHDYTGDAPIFIVPFGVPISDPVWVQNLIQAIEAACGVPPVMIWLDTLARTFGQGDENSQKDMNAFVTGADALRDHFQCVVGVVHHTGKEDSRGLRGSSALYAAMDTVIRTDRKAGKMVVTLKNQQPNGKQKDAAEFADIALEARVIGLGATDKKGREITSLALVLGEAEPEAADEDGAGPRQGGANVGPRGANQQAVVAALKKAKGEPLGLMRLVGMTGLGDSKVAQAVKPLVEKGLVIETGDRGAKRWTLA